MKDINSYTVDDIKEIWHDMQPGSLTKAFNLLLIKCDNLQNELNKVNGANNEVAVCEHKYQLIRDSDGDYYRCKLCGRIM